MTKAKPPARKRILFETSEQVEVYLDDLVALGIFGGTKEAVAEFLVCEGLRRLLIEGLLKPRNPTLNQK